MVTPPRICMPFAVVSTLLGCGGAATPPAPTPPVSAVVEAAAPEPGGPCGDEHPCPDGLICVASDVIPHTGQRLMTCEVPCGADADCDRLVPEAELACVTAARTATDCQCTPGTPLVRCEAPAGDPAARVCNLRSIFQDYGRPRCR